MPRRMVRGVRVEVATSARQAGSAARAELVTNSQSICRRIEVQSQETEEVSER